MKRRTLLRGAAAAGLLAGCGSEGTGGLLPPPASDGIIRSILRGTRAEIADEEMELVAGQVPPDMLGHALVVGGIPYGDGTPLFTGDGLIARFSFEGGRARLTTRLVRTDDFLLDEAATSPSLAYRNQGFARISSALGARDFANTGLVTSPGGRLIAAYDAGRPWEIDPLTLDVVAPVGLHSAWRPMLPALTPGLALFPINMVTAHPVWDPEDDVLYAANFAPPLEGLSVEAFTRVLVWDGEREPVATELVTPSGEPVILEQSCHQMQTTRRWVILSDGAFNIETQQTAGMDVTRAQRPTTVLWLVEKSALRGATATATRVEIPIESAHFLVDREDTGDRLRVFLMHQPSQDPSEWIRATDTLLSSGAPADPATVGMMVGAADTGIQGKYVVDARTGTLVDSETRLLEDDRLWGYTLWSRDERRPDAPLGENLWVTLGYDPLLVTRRIGDAYRDHPYRRVPLDELPTSPLPPRIVRVDHGSMQILEDLAFPVGWLPMSPTFVPRRNGGQGEGYLVCPVLGPSDDEVWIFSAADLTSGPICRLRHPRFDVGFSLHTTWLPELVAPSSGYRRSRDDDYGAALPMLSEEARALVRTTLELGDRR